MINYSNKKPSIDEVVKLLKLVFQQYYPKADDAWYQEQIQDANLDISFFAYKNDELIACYILKEENEPFNKMKGRGIRGDALAIHPNYQKKGIFNNFYRQLVNLDYDYFWGTQGKELNNLTFWAKYRIVIGEDSNHFYTAGYLKKETNA